MNTALVCIQSIGWFGCQWVLNQLLKLTGNLSGYGWSALFIRCLVKQKAWTVPLLNWKVFTRLLADFARHFGLGKHKRIILVVDQASFHISDKVRIPDGIHLLFLPSKSPELQPAERLWTLTNEAIANT